ncbi:alpha/beta hydrolase [Xylophilus sp.]|uniref:alpha/beta hydrolase n=1 Tax=Xylophilus sp. TaxID=2653893 RepID=UPI0013BDF434|nr:alpha/beta hydrolase [Xylophilus sp.]KAF1046647.1 MAG: Monoacylglycerol lipase [Xylophilus sp.]
MRDSALSTFTASDGDNIALQDWPAAGEAPVPRGLILLVHGLGEHAGRYDRLARRLCGWGFAVRGYDQYGHGESGGPRGALPNDERLVDDLADVVDSTRAMLPAGVPLILLGHSLGGLVAARFVAQHRRAVDGLVLSSPAFAVGLRPLQRLLLAAVPRLAPDLRVSSGLDPRQLSHDPAVARAWRSDPLCHDLISGRLARFIATAGPQALDAAARWRVPTLLLYGGSDRVVQPAGSQAFAAMAPVSTVNSHRFDDLYHEVFNEQDGEPVDARLRQWLDRYPAKAPHGV